MLKHINGYHKNDMVVKTCEISVAQQKFIKEECINFSAMVRDCIEKRIIQRNK